jgi:hypothetical protein
MMLQSIQVVLAVPLQPVEQPEPHTEQVLLLLVPVQVDVQVDVQSLQPGSSSSSKNRSITSSFGSSQPVKLPSNTIIPKTGNALLAAFLKNSRLEWSSSLLSSSLNFIFFILFCYESNPVMVRTKIKTSIPSGQPHK